MTYRETRSERAAAARWNEPKRRNKSKFENTKFRWSLHRDEQSSKRDWYGFINLDTTQAQLFIDWLRSELESPDYANADGSITLLLSGWDNTGRNGRPYIGGLGAPSLGNETLPNKPQRSH